MDDLKERIEAIPGRHDQVRERIERAAQAAGQEPAHIRLIAITKSFPLEIVRGAIAAGITDIGENRVQEGRKKIEALGREAATWHLVGHLQSNKARWALRFFDMIQSVDSLHLAGELQHRAELEETEIPVLVQVNTSGEDSKHGIESPELRRFLEGFAAFNRLKVEGLMTIGLFDEREEIVRPAFVGLRRLFEEIPAWGIPGIEMKHLSMGMSNDYEWAVAEGATMIRLGSVLFGPRD